MRHFINISAVKDYVHSKGKRISPNALDALNGKVMATLLKATKNCRQFKTIGATEILY